MRCIVLLEARTLYLPQNCVLRHLPAIVVIQTIHNMPKTQSVLKRVLDPFKRLLRDVDDSIIWIYSPTVKYIEIYRNIVNAVKKL